MTKAFLFLLVTANFCYAQTRKEIFLKGEILDSQTQKPIHLAVIHFKNHWDVWTSDKLGNFKIQEPIALYEDTLTVRATGYESVLVALNYINIEEKALKITLKPLWTLADSTEAAKNKSLAEKIMQKVINNLPENYLETPYCYEATFQQVIHEIEGKRAFEKNDAIIYVREKGLKKDNITTRISLQSLDKWQHLDYASLRGKLLSIGGDYNYLYKMADCDFVRAFYSKNEFSKWTPSFFKANSIFQEYDLAILDETYTTYILVMKLKDTFSKLSVADKVNKMGGEMKEFGVVGAPSLNFSLNEIETIKITIQKSNYGISKIENKAHTAKFPTACIRNDYEIGYKCQGGKYYFDYAKVWSPLGKIGFNTPRIYVYSELKVNKYLMEKEIKKVNKDIVERRIELYDIPQKHGNVIFKPLKPYF